VAGERPRDVSALIDAAVDGAIAPDLLGDVVDTDRIAVSGHSFGGYTALAAAGGNPLFEFEGDDRIDAIVPLAPAARAELLPDETLAAMTVPTLFIGGTLDSTTPIGPNIGRAVDLMASETLYQLDLEDAGHFTFTDVCGFAEAVEAQLGQASSLFLDQLPGYPETCDGSRLSVEEAHPEIIRATAGFLLDELDLPAPGAPEPPYATERVGEFPVGKTTVLVDVPHRDADLPVEVWYPADAASAADAERGEYTLRVPFGDGEFTLRQDSPLSLEEPAVADGRFPLVVFSHGSGGVRFQSLFLGEELASHGFVVIAPDHLGNTFADGLDPDPTANPARDRPRDVSALLDAAEAGDLSPLLGDGVDTDRVAVAGHSFGGYTALAAAGGNPDVDYAPDPRVDAIVPIAPATRSTLLSDEVLAGIDVPALFIGGTADDVTPIVPNVTRPQALMASDPLYRIDVEDAGHYSFSNVCDFAAAISDQLGAAAGFVLNILPGYPESCDGTLRDIDEVLDITSLATTGFLQTELGGPDITDPTDPDPTPDPTDPDPTDPGRPLDRLPGRAGRQRAPGRDPRARPGRDPPRRPRRSLPAGRSDHPRAGRGGPRAHGRPRAGDPVAVPGRGRQRPRGRHRGARRRGHHRRLRRRHLPAARADPARPRRRPRRPLARCRAGRRRPLHRHRPDTARRRDQRAVRDRCGERADGLDLRAVARHPA
jgi:predicted dienelactone hydrolase